jgi:hypothetical protein
MKPIFLVVAIFMMITSSGNTSAQNKDAVASYFPGFTGNSISRSPDNKNSKSNANKINASVLRNFIRSHENPVETRDTKVNIRAVRHFPEHIKISQMQSGI